MSLTSTLPPYSGTCSACPKCGATEAATRWHPSGMCVHAGGDSYTIDNHQGSMGIERMCRTCHRCGYQWDEAPRDDPSRPGNKAATQAPAGA